MHLILFTTTVVRIDWQALRLNSISNRVLDVCKASIKAFNLQMSLEDNYLACQKNL